MSAALVGESSGIERGDLTAEDADRLASSFRASWEDLDEGQITAGSATLPDNMEALIAPPTAAPLVNVANLSKTLPMPVRSPAAGMRPVAHAHDTALEDDVLPKKSGRGLVYGAVGAVALVAIGILAVNGLRSKDADPRVVEPASTNTSARDIPPPSTVEPATTAAATPKAVETAPAKAELPKGPEGAGTKGLAKAETAPPAKVEAPKIEAPKAEAPKVEAPKGAAKVELKEAPKTEPKTAAAPPKAPVTAAPPTKPPAAAAAEPKTAPKAPQTGIVRDTPF